ncbi:MAG: ABC transporter permease [Pseudomonadota bacterium]
MVRLVGRSFLLLWLASLVAFATIRAMPGDPAVLLLTDAHLAVTPEAIAALHKEWGLDRSLVEQYWFWLARFISGDWGTSFRTRQPILHEFLARLPVSLALGLGGLALATAVAIALGFEAAARPNGVADRLSRAITVLSQSVPIFVTGLFAIWLLAIEFRLIRPFSGGFLEQIVLPTLIVALYSTGSLVRVFRSELRAVQTRPFFRTALAKGLSPRQALRRHGSRHALFGLLGALTPECGWAIGGTAVTEVVFAVPGISDFLVQSIAARDYFVLQGYIVAISVWMLAVGLVAGLVRRRLDPRIQ